MALDREALDVLKNKIDDNHVSASRSKSTKIYFLLLAVMVFIAVGVWGVERKWGLPEDKQVENMSAAIKNAAAIETPVVEKAEAPERNHALLTGSGYVVPNTYAKVSSLFTGRISEILVDEGSWVSKGQLIARLDDSMISKKVALAESELEREHLAVKEVSVKLALAKKKLKRSKTLLSIHQISEENFDNIAAEVDILEARLERSKKDILVQERNLALAKEELKDMEVRAPIKGVVTDIEVGIGEVVSPVLVNSDSTVKGICTIIDMESLLLEVDVSESYIGKIKDSGYAEVKFEAFPKELFVATLKNIVPLASRQKGTVKVVLSFEDLKGNVYPGMSAQVWFLEGQPDFVSTAGNGNGVNVVEH